MKQIDIDADLLGTFCQSTASLFSAVIAAQDADVQAACAAAIRDGAELVLEVHAVSGQFLAVVQSKDGRRTTITEVALGMGLVS